MSGTNRKLPEIKQEMPLMKAPTPPMARPVKVEPISRQQIFVTPIHNDYSGRPPSPTPSGSTVVVSRRASQPPLQTSSPQQQHIFIRDLSSIMDPDQMTTVAVTRARPVNNDPSDWRLSIGKVGKRLKHILENSQFSDVTLVVGSTTKEDIKAHKLILRMASPVFDDLFNEAEEKAHNGSVANVIPIPDVQPSIFKVLLNYIYHDGFSKSSLEPDSMFDLLQASRMFNLKHLSQQCIKSLKKNMTDKNALKLCDLDACNGDVELRSAALDHVAEIAYRIFPMDEFAQLSEETVMLLCSRDDLRIEEFTVFEAALRWGCARCEKEGLEKTSENLRMVMENIIPEIRFTLLTNRELTIDVTKSKLLTSQELLNIYMNMSASEMSQSDKDQLPKIPYKTKARLPIRKEIDNIDSGSSSDFREVCSPSPEQHRKSVPMPSVASTEYVDYEALFENDSETASNVSGFSESRRRKKSRNYARSNSQSSGASSTTKRMKLDKEKNAPRKRIESRRRTSTPEPEEQDEDIFEEVTTFTKSGKVKLNEVVNKLSGNESRSTIETVLFKNATSIEDAEKLNFKPVKLRNLKTFKLDLAIDKEIMRDNKTIVDKLIFFDIKHPRMDRLWKTKIDIHLVVNKTVQMSISHKKQAMILNNFNTSEVRSILSSLREEDLKSLVLYEVFTEKIPQVLPRLSLLRVEGTQETINFVRNLKYLKELSLVFRNTPSTDAPPLTLTLDATFQSKDKICTLALGWLNLTLEPCVRYYNLKSLSLYRVSWEPVFEDRFHQTFPKLQELHFIGLVGSSTSHMRGSTKFLRNLLTRLDNLAALVVCCCPFFSNPEESKEVKELLAPYQLPESDNNFCLERQLPSKEWKGKKISLFDSHKYCYSKLGFDNVFTDSITYTLS